MTDSLVQQHPRPSRPQHHFHLARRRLARIELHNRLPRRLMGKVLGSFFRVKEFQRHPASAARAAARASSVLPGDAKNIHARQRLEIAGESPVGADHQNAAQLFAIVGPHLEDARIVGAGGCVGPLHQGQLGADVGIYRERIHRIKIALLVLFQVHYRLLRRAAGDKRRGARRTQNFFRRQVVGVGIAGTLAGDDSDCAACRNALRGRFHHGFIERDGGGGEIFEVQIGVIAARAQRRAQIALQVGFIEPILLKEKFLLVLIHLFIGCAPLLADSHFLIIPQRLTHNRAGSGNLDTSIRAWL